MLLTILGAGAAAPNPGGACSSYLVRQAGTALVLDMGSGTFAQLQRHVAPDEVTAIVISHLHADHTLDLIPYRYWLAFRGERARRRPRLLLPPGGHAALLRLSAMQDPSPEFFRACFEVEEYDPARPQQLGAMAVGFHAVRHIPHTYALRVTGDTILAYSADSGPCDALAEVARAADLFLCECSNPAHSDFPLHLKAGGAATYARDGGARRLVLTHRWHEIGLEEAVREAAAVYPGPISLAREGDTYAIGPGRGD